jgi:hypothetical protein
MASDSAIRAPADLILPAVGGSQMDDDIRIISEPDPVPTTPEASVAATTSDAPAPDATGESASTHGAANEPLTAQAYTPPDARRGVDDAEEPRDAHAAERMADTYPHLVHFHSTTPWERAPEATTPEEPAPDLTLDAVTSPVAPDAPAAEPVVDFAAPTPPADTPAPVSTPFAVTPLPALDAAPAAPAPAGAAPEPPAEAMAAAPAPDDTPAATRADVETPATALEQPDDPVDASASAPDLTAGQPAPSADPVSDAVDPVGVAAPASAQPHNANDLSDFSDFSDAAPEPEPPFVTWLHAVAEPTQGSADRALAISERPTTPMLPDLPNMELSEPPIIGRLDLLSRGIEELVEALGAVGAGTPLPDEPLRALIAEAPNINVRTWLRALLYLGRVVAPTCREALRIQDVRRARLLAAEIANAAPAVAGAVRASIMLAGFTIGSPDEFTAPDAAPMLRRALTSDRVARCLAHLLNDLTALETWLAATASLGVGPWVAPGWHTPGAAGRYGLQAPPAYSAPPFSALASLPPLPPQLPPHTSGRLPSWSYPPRHPSGRLVPYQRQLAAPVRATPHPRPFAPPSQGGGAIPSPAPDEPGALNDPSDRISYATGDRRIFGGVLMMTIVLLVLAVALPLLLQGSDNLSAAGRSGAVPTANVALEASPTAAVSPTATAAPVPTATPQPTPQPTITAVRPGVSTLTLVCGTPGVALPLQNPAASPLTWTLTLPASVTSTGLRGVVNPGKTYTIYLWERAGTKSGAATAYVVSQGHKTSINLSLPGC